MVDQPADPTTKGLSHAGANQTVRLQGATSCRALTPGAFRPDARSGPTRLCPSLGTCHLSRRPERVKLACYCAFRYSLIFSKVRLCIISVMSGND